jgi:hypothetical protein
MTVLAPSPPLRIVAAVFGLGRARKIRKGAGSFPDRRLVWGGGSWPLCGLAGHGLGGWSGRLDGGGGWHRGRQLAPYLLDLLGPQPLRQSGMPHQRVFGDLAVQDQVDEAIGIDGPLPPPLAHVEPALGLLARCAHRETRLRVARSSPSGKRSTDIQTYGGRGLTQRRPGTRSPRAR